MEHPEVPGDGERLEELTAGAEELTASLNDLVESVQSLEAKSRVNQRVVAVLSVLVVLKLATIIVLIVALVGLSNANHRVQESLRQNYVTAQQQVETRIKVLCPLYGALVASVNPAMRASLPPEQQKQFDANAKIIKDGYRTLGCQPPLK